MLSGASSSEAGERRGSLAERQGNKVHGFSTSSAVAFVHRSARLRHERVGKINKTNVFGRTKSCGQPLGEGWPRAIRSGTGRGGDVTGSRNSFFDLSRGFRSALLQRSLLTFLALAVATAGRPS